MIEYIKVTYDKDGIFLINKKTSKIRKSTFEKEIISCEAINYNTWVKETKRKRIEFKAIKNLHK